MPNLADLYASNSYHYSEPRDFSKNTVAKKNLSDLLAKTSESGDIRDGKWSDEEKRKQALYTVLHAIDWAQTRHLSRSFANNPDRHEQNPILGMHPSTDKVDAYFALTGLGHYLLADKLSPEWRNIFQNTTIGLEAGAAGNNARLGLKAKF